MRDGSDHNTFEEAISAIRELEIDTDSQFVVARKTRNFNNNYAPDELKNQRIRFSGNSKVISPQVPNIPFIVIGSCDLSCIHGKSRTEKDKAVTSDIPTDHAYTGRKIRKRKQKTKKQGCPCRLVIQEVLTFKGFKNPGTSRKKRLSLAKSIKEDKNYITERLFLLYQRNDHIDHVSGQISGVTKNLSKSVCKKVHELVQSGVTKIPIVKKELEKYVEGLPFKRKPSIFNEQYFPSNKTIYNHIQLAISKNRYSDEEQENTRQKLITLAREAGFRYHFRAHSEKDNQKFLIVIQQEWQRQILNTFGECTLIDSTFDTSRYDLPLYEVVVHCNVGFTPVAVIITEDATEEIITDGLKILRDWNPEWDPCSFITDCDVAQSNALRHIFPECSQYLCLFHLTQAWKRWLARSENNLLNEKKDILYYLKSIAEATTINEYEERLHTLKTTREWMENTRLQNYISSVWLKIAEKWVRAFRPLDENIVVTTTNGVEVHHRILKSLLENHGCRTVQSLVDVIVNEYFREMLKRYVSRNVQPKKNSRIYHESMPSFLIEKTPVIMEHCLKRISDAILIDETMIEQESDSSYSVLSTSSPDQHYAVNLAIPSCECFDFQTHFMPCKHILAIFVVHKSSVVLCEKYLNSKYFIINEKFLQWVNENNFDKQCINAHVDHLTTKAEAESATLSEERKPNQRPGPNSARNNPQFRRLKVPASFLKRRLKTKREMRKRLCAVAPGSLAKRKLARKQSAETKGLTIFLQEDKTEMISNAQEKVLMLSKADINQPEESNPESYTRMSPIRQKSPTPVHALDKSDTEGSGPLKSPCSRKLEIPVHTLESSDEEPDPSSHPTPMKVSDMQPGSSSHPSPRKSSGNESGPSSRPSLRKPPSPLHTPEASDDEYMEVNDQETQMEETKNVWQSSTDKLQFPDHLARENLDISQCSADIQQGHVESPQYIADSDKETPLINFEKASADHSIEELNEHEAPSEKVEVTNEDKSVPDEKTQDVITESTLKEGVLTIDDNTRNRNEKHIAKASKTSLSIKKFTQRKIDQFSHVVIPDSPPSRSPYQITGPQNSLEEENATQMKESGVTFMKSNRPNSLTLEEIKDEIAETEDEHSPLTEEEINAYYKKVPFNPSFQITLPENIEVNPYFPNLMRLKPTPLDDCIISDTEEYKPKRKIVTSGKPLVKDEIHVLKDESRSEEDSDGIHEEVPLVKEDEIHVLKDESSLEEDSDGIHEEVPLVKEDEIHVLKDESSSEEDSDGIHEEVDPIIPNVEDIWKYHSKSDSLMAIVGPYKLYGNSFASLKYGNEVVDEVIDAYMKCLVDAYQNTASMDCCVAGSVINRPSTCSLQKKLSFEMFQRILLPFNSGGHWELLIVFPAKKEVLYINPLGESTKRLKTIEESWKTYINRRYSKGLETSGPTGWRVKTVHHSKQFDGVNCGIFIMKFAELELQGKQLHFNSRKMDTFREEIAGTLIGSCGNVTNNCRACGNSYRFGDEWIQCSSCLWWHHFGCTSVEKSYKEAGRESFYFLCKTCQGYDVPCQDVHFHKRSRPNSDNVTCKNDMTEPQTIESFVVCKLNNLIKICAGCRFKFKKPVQAPVDHVIRHREHETFFDKKLGSMRKVFNNKYYHISANCIQARNPNFVKSSICVPPDVQLTNEHLVYFNANGIDLKPFLNRKI